MKLRALALSILMVLSVLAVGLSFGTGVAAAAGNQTDLDTSDLAGSGTSDDPYQISNASELQAMEDDLSAHYELVSDIDASGTSEWNSGSGFDPIWDSTTTTPFTGAFNGNDYTVSNLTINRSTEDKVGLFGYIGSDGTVKNLRLTDGDITGNSQVGTVVGENIGRVENVSSKASVNGSYSSIGGLAGDNNMGTVKNSPASGTVDGEINVAGLVGYNRGTVTQSSATSTVTGSQYRIGGLVGWNSGGTVKNSSASGTVNGPDDVGGLLGNNGGTVSNSSATSTVNGSSQVGGLVGRNYDATVTTSYATG